MTTAAAPPRWLRAARRQLAQGPREADRGPTIAWSDPPPLPPEGTLPNLQVTWGDWDIAPTILCANLPPPPCPRCGWDGVPWICSGAVRRPGRPRVIALVHGFCCPGCRREHFIDRGGSTVTLVDTACGRCISGIEATH